MADLKTKLVDRLVQCDSLNCKMMFIPSPDCVKWMGKIFCPACSMIIYDTKETRRQAKERGYYCPTGKCDTFS